MLEPRTTEMRGENDKGQARIIMPSERSLADIDDVVIVHHGLPGIAGKERREREVKEQIRNGKNIAGIFPYPKGIKSPSGNATERLSIAEYINNLSLITQSVRKRIREDAGLHLVGHSYGAIAVLNTLKEMQEKGLPPPNSIHFLAPFVKIATQTENPEIKLSIVNARGRVDDLLSPTEQEAKLREVLAECVNFYEIGGDLFDEHGKLFTDQFYATIGNLEEFTRESNVQIVRGENDEFIGEGHTELIRSRLGQNVPEKIIPSDGHSLETVRIIEEILAA